MNQKEFEMEAGSIVMVVVMVVIGLSFFRGDKRESGIGIRLLKL